jgi:recombinational DNA repair protein RecR
MKTICLSEFGRKHVSKLRTSNCKMPIETRRWQNVSREDRICHLCRDGVGDEYHHLLLCKDEAAFEIRQEYIPRYHHLNSNINKICGLLSPCNVKLLSNITVFLNELNKLF